MAASSPTTSGTNLTPWDFGYDRVVRFDHDFTGRAALETMKDQPHRRKVWLIWNDDDVARVMAGSLFGAEKRAKYLTLPLAGYVTLQYDEAGPATAWSGCPAGPATRSTSATSRPSP